MDIQEEEKAFARLEKIIGRYKPTDIEKAIKEFQEFIENGYGCSKLPSSWSIRLALSALQEQSEREKGCKYCENEKPFEIHFGGEKAGIAYLHKCSDGWGLFLQMDGGDTFYTDVSNCPRCGKRLE